MSDIHPYISAPGTLARVIHHLRGSFPTSVTSDTLKKLGYAPKNESYLLNILRFLGLIDENDMKTNEASKMFSLHDNHAFEQAFSERVKSAYAGLFELHNDRAWDLDIDALITFFRHSDQTSGIVGKRQAVTFRALAGLSGHGDVPQPKTASPRKSKEPTGKKVSPQKSSSTNSFTTDNLNNNQHPNFGLTVRIEINLPADGDQGTYDRIFKSIKENLING